MENKESVKMEQLKNTKAIIDAYFLADYIPISNKNYIEQLIEMRIKDIENIFEESIPKNKHGAYELELYHYVEFSEIFNEKERTAFLENAIDIYQLRELMGFLDVKNFIGLYKLRVAIES